MITAAQLRKAAMLVDRGWVQRAWHSRSGYCVSGAASAVSGLFPSGLGSFERHAISHNDAPDCTKDAAVMFLLLAAEAREHGDL